MFFATTANFSRWNTLFTASIDVFAFGLHQPHEALCYFKVSCFCTYLTFVMLISHRPLLNFNIPNCQHGPLHSLIPTPLHFFLGTNHKRRYNVSKSNFFRFCTTSNSYIFQTIRLTIIVKLCRCNTFLTTSIDVFTFGLHQPHEALCSFKVSCFRTYSTFLILISHRPLLNFNIPNYQHVPLHSLIPTPPHFSLGTNHKRRYNVSKSNFFRFCTISISYNFQTMCPTTTANFSRWNTLLTASIDILTILLHQPHEALRHFKLSCFCIYSTFVILISHLPLLNFSIPNYQHVPLHSLIATPPFFSLGNQPQDALERFKIRFFPFLHYFNLL